MNQLELNILRFVSARCYPGQLRPTTAEVYRMFGFPASKHALAMLQINGHIGVLPHRKAKGIKRYEVRPAGLEVLKRVAA